MQKKKIDEYTRFEMCNSLYLLLLQYFEDTNDNDEEEKIKTEIEACKYSVKFLIPYLERQVYNSEEYMPKYYELWEKALAFAGRRYLEYFIDYMELDLPAKSKVLANRRNVLKPFIFYLNKCAYDKKLQYIEASFPPRIWKELYVK